MGKFGLLFLIAAIAIGYDAVMYDGAYTKQVWQQARDAGSALGDKIDRTLDRNPATPSDRISTGAPSQ